MLILNDHAHSPTNQNFHGQMADVEPDRLLSLAGQYKLVKNQLTDLL